MNDTKITNVKTTVTLKKDFTYTFYGVDTTIPKGTKFNARDVRLDGLVIVLGHGNTEVIPHNYLGKYIKTYNITREMFDGRNGFETFRKTVKEDVTDVWIAHWKKLAEKNTANNVKAELNFIKRKIADLRKTIKFVKNGEAEKELARLVEKIA